MKIYIHVWKAYSYADISATFRQMGHQVVEKEWELKNYDQDEAFEAYLGRRLREEEFDFVFSVNYFAAIANVCHAQKIPYVVWTCDNPLISMYHRSVFYPENYIFSFDFSNVQEWKAQGLSHIYYLPLATNVGRMQSTIEQTKTDVSYETDVAFVGSLYEQNSYDRLAPSLPDYLRGYFDAVITAQQNICGGNLIERMLTPDILCELEQYYHLEKSEDSFSTLALVFATTVLGFKVAKEQRKSALLQLGRRFSVKLYSNDVPDLLGVSYGGSLDYFGEMPLVFQKSKVNLNLTIPNIKTGIPLRVWDVLGAGGFLVTNYQAELPQFFENHKDLVWFESEKELVEIVEYYLTHEQERRKIAQNGREKVQEFHSYQTRIRQIFEILRADGQCG